MSKHVKDKISLYIDGMLADAELKAFEEHVKTCGECANLLALTKRAVEAVPKPAEEPLPVNFYVKLNKKLDAAEAKKRVFNWQGFMRGTAVVFTMLIAGVFVYTIKNQTNNFNGVTMKQDAQMPEKQANDALGGLSGEAEGDYVIRERLKDEPVPVIKKKAAALALDAKIKGYMDESRAKETAVLMDVTNKPAPVEKKIELIKNTEAKQEAASSRSVKASAPVVKMMKSVSAPEDTAADGVLAEAPAADTGAAVVEEAESNEPYEAGPQTFVFKDEKAWRVYAAGNGVKEPSAIDWTQQMVVAVFLPARPTEGYRVEITNAEFLKDRITVYYKEYGPLPDSANAQVVTYPHGEKIVKKSNLPVEFEKVE